MEGIAKVLEALLKIAKAYGIATVVALLAISLNVYLVRGQLKAAAQSEVADRAQRAADAAVFAAAVSKLTESVTLMTNQQVEAKMALSNLATQVQVLQTLSMTMRRTAAIQHDTARAVNAMTSSPALERVLSAPGPSR